MAILRLLLQRVFLCKDSNDDRIIRDDSLPDEYVDSNGQKYNYWVALCFKYKVTVADLSNPGNTVDYWYPVTKATVDKVL